MFSWDDADTLDRKYVKLFNKLGIKCTFNVNSENLGVLPNKFSSDEIAAVYAGHEIASHTLMHPNLTDLDDDEVVRQVEQDRLNLQYLSGYPVIGFAYPGGGPLNYDERVKKLIREKTGVRYARTGKSTLSFDPPDDFYEWDPTSHMMHGELDGAIDSFIKLKPDTIKILFIWGHSYELEPDGLYERFEKLCEKVSGHNEIDYVSCGVAYDLIQKERGL